MRARVVRTAAALCGAGRTLTLEVLHQHDCAAVPPVAALVVPGGEECSKSTATPKGQPPVVTHLMAVAGAMAIQEAEDVALSVEAALQLAVHAPAELKCKACLCVFINPVLCA